MAAKPAPHRHLMFPNTPPPKPRYKYLLKKYYQDESVRPPAPGCGKNTLCLTSILKFRGQTADGALRQTCGRRIFLPSFLATSDFYAEIQTRQSEERIRITKQSAVRSLVCFPGDHTASPLTHITADEFSHPGETRRINAVLCLSLLSALL